jgi:hypothetical protein
MRPRSRLVWLVVLAALVAAPGCEEKRVSHTRTVPQSTEPPPEPSPAPAPAAPEGGHGFIVGQKTQDIRDASVEQQKGAQVAGQTIVARDPITLPGNAYVTIIGRNSMLNIQHALDLYQASEGRYPKDYPEFMDVIIKANNIALPTLPHYQEYGYDAPNHRLIILEYPDRKANPPKF